MFIISKIICRIDEVRILSCYDSTHYNDLSQNYANVMRLEIYYQLECRSAFVLEKALKWPNYPPTEPKSAKKLEIEALQILPITGLRSRQMLPFTALYTVLQCNEKVHS
jgi:hypothetical protein